MTNINTQSLIKNLRLTVSSFFIFFISFSATATEDSYLKAMEAEAENVYLDSSATTKSDSPVVNGNASSSQSNVQINSKMRQEFESALQKRFSKSFDSYAKLNDENKALVIDTYFSNSKNILIAVNKLYKLHFKK